jgi:Protein of unknown function (DUF3293)
MMTADQVGLEGLYVATAFRVEAPDGHIDIRIGEKDAQIDALLSKLNAIEWAYITAWNPGSRPVPAEQNTLAHDKLLQIIRGRGFTYYEGDGIPDQEGWAPERSVWIAGIGRDEAVELGRRFGQNAIVVGRLVGVAELVPCDESQR